MRRLHCRICDGSLNQFLNLGNIYPSNFVDNQENLRAEILCLVQCDKCGLLQLEHTVDLDSIYRRYWYKSSLNPTMVRDLSNIRDSILKRIELKDGDVVLDIGCNDGTLLRLFEEVNNHIYTIGFDPALNLADEAQSNCTIFINDYFSIPKNGLSRSVWRNYAKIVTSIAMFYDLENPREFIEDVKFVLKKDGIWVIQFQDLVGMLKTNAFDNICLAKGELVTTIEGNRPIDEIEEGQLVLTHKGRFRPVLKKYITPYNKQLLELKAYGMGHSIKITPNHKILVKRDSWIYIRADEIKIGDIISRPVVLEPPKYIDDVPLTIDIAKIIGYYLSEGSYNLTKKNGNVVSFYFNKEEEFTLVEDLKQALTNSGYKANKYYNGSVVYITTYGKIANWLYKHFGRLSYKKHISYWVLDQNQEFMETLLRAYIDGDGYLYRKNNYYRASTVSSQLAFDISLIANRLGYKSSICKCKVPETSFIMGREVNRKDCWDILIHLNPKLKQKTWMMDKKQVARVKSIKELDYKEKFVYNLEVEEDNSYVTPAMTVSNCHEHLEYYSLNILTKLLKQHNLDIFDVEYNQVNGGSIRAYVCHEGEYRINNSTKEYVMNERYYLDTFLPIFAQNVLGAIFELKDFIEDELKEGKTFFVLGASTKGNTLLQVAGLNNEHILRALEVNPDKWGKRTVGTNIPIIDDDLLEKYVYEYNMPDYLLVLPWHFNDFFNKKYEWFMETGGKLVYPLPSLTVLPQEKENK